MFGNEITVEVTVETKHCNYGYNPGKVDRKIDLLVGKFWKYSVSVVGIQETK